MLCEPKLVDDPCNQRSKELPEAPRRRKVDERQGVLRRQDGRLKTHGCLAVLAWRSGQVVTCRSGGTAANVLAPRRPLLSTDYEQVLFACLDLHSLQSSPELGLLGLVW